MLLEELVHLEELEPLEKGVHLVLLAETVCPLLAFDSFLPLTHSTT